MIQFLGNVLNDMGTHHEKHAKVSFFHITPAMNHPQIFFSIFV
jgi:hypothetical protein